MDDESGESMEPMEDYLTIVPKLRSTYDVRLIHKTSYEGRKAFLRYNSLAQS